MRDRKVLVPMLLGGVAALGVAALLSAAESALKKDKFEIECVQGKKPQCDVLKKGGKGSADRTEGPNQDEPIETVAAAMVLVTKEPTGKHKHGIPNEPDDIHTRDGVADSGPRHGNHCWVQIGGQWHVYHC